MNKKTLITVSSIATVGVLTAGAAFYYFSNQEQPISEGGLVTETSNPEIATLGLMLINNGGLTADDASEFNESQYNFFEDAGLSSNSSPGKVYVMADTVSPESFIENFNESFNINMVENRTDLVEMGEGSYMNFLTGTTNEGFEIVLSLFKEPYTPLNWEYSHSENLGVLSPCPNLEPPIIYNYRIQSYDEIIDSTPPGQEPNIFPDVETLSEAELNSLFFMDAYRFDVQEYENACASSVSVDLNQAETEAKNFLEKIGLDVSNISTSSFNNEEETQIVVSAYQNIGNQKGLKIATINLNYQNSVVTASGLSYELVERATIETLTPAESIERTLQPSRIVGSIHPDYFTEYNLITTTSPKTDKTAYEMNRSENIIVTIATIDGYLIVPGYILYNNNDKTGIYTVAVPQKYFGTTQ